MMRGARLLKLKRAFGSWPNDSSSLDSAGEKYTAIFLALDFYFSSGPSGMTKFVPAVGYGGSS